MKGGPKTAGSNAVNSMMSVLDRVKLLRAIEGQEVLGLPIPPTLQSTQSNIQPDWLGKHIHTVGDKVCSSASDCPESQDAHGLPPTFSTTSTVWVILS